MTANWSLLRGRFALEGVDWRSWTAADRASAMYVLLRRSLNGDDLRELHKLVGDTAAIAEMDRQKMGQDRTIETTR